MGVTDYDPRENRMAALTTAELAIGLHATGGTVCLTPAEAPMTREALTAWFTLRGVHDPAYLDELLTEHLGRTETEMDDRYAAMHR
jgi:hypothetical protein